MVMSVRLPFFSLKLQPIRAVLLIFGEGQENQEVIANKCRQRLLSSVIHESFWSNWHAIAIEWINVCDISIEILIIYIQTGMRWSKSQFNCRSNKNNEINTRMSESCMANAFPRHSSLFV